MTLKYPYSNEQAKTVSSVINGRVSVMQTKMVGNCTPTDAELETIFQSALAVPDHGQKHPARFIVITGDKLADFIKQMYAIKKAAKPDFVLSEAEYTKNFAGVGMFLVAYAKISDSNIPAYEHEWSVAASIQNMLNMFYAHGFAAKWNSIFKESDAGFKSYLNVDEAWTSMGYIIIGKSADTAKIKSRENYQEHFRTF